MPTLRQQDRIKRQLSRGRVRKPKEELGLRAGRFRRGFAAPMLEHIVGPKVVRQARLMQAYFDANCAHVLMLERRRLLPRKAVSRLLRGLRALRDDKAFEPDPNLDDLFGNTEKYLMQRIGEAAAGSLHIGRSRNDLDATALRLTTRARVERVIEELIGLQLALINLAAEHRDTAMPEYTHLQHAQPGTLAHYLLGFRQLLEWDLQRLAEAVRRINLNPLGCGAICGTGFPIDRALTTRLLGFDAPVANSLAGVSSREFALEAMGGIAILAVNLSRLAEDLIIWSTSEFHMVELDDGYCGTSSMMPQKKNPTALETVRSSAGRLIGLPVSGLATLKGTNLGHNWDCFELDDLVLDAADTAAAMLQVLRGVVGTAKFHKVRMRANAVSGFSTATDLADLLVAKCNLPFRNAHRIVGRVVAQAIQDGVALQEIRRAHVAAAAAQFGVREISLSDRHVRQALSVRESISNHCSVGGPAPTEVRRQIKAATRDLSVHRRNQARRKAKYERARQLMRAMTREVLGS